MNENNKICFSNRAYNSIVSETYDKVETETGGILLGRTVDDTWYVVEVIDPGPNSVFLVTYFEYDTLYVNHLAKTISKQYKIELAVLGLWHRHPGSMDTFSLTDDLTNAEFSKLHPKGALSGLVNIDPTFRLTMYHVSLPLKYTKISFEVGDHLFPFNLLECKYSFSENGSHGVIQQTYKTSSLVNNANLVKKIISKLTPFFYKKSQIATTNNQGLPDIRDLPVIKKLDEDYLIDLYANEEIQLENELRVKYKSEVKNDRILYSVYEFSDGGNIGFSISFSVNLDVNNPMFQCIDKDYRFSPGIFTRYVESKIRNKEFIG